MSFLYAAWNRDVGFASRLVGVSHNTAMPLEAEVPDDLARQSAFEADQLRIGIELLNPRGPRGPVRASGRIGGSSVSVSAGVVPRGGRHEERVVGPARRGPVASEGWVRESGDPLGLFVRRTPGGDGELALVLPRFASLRRPQRVRELEASMTAPRAGHGTEVYGVREYHPGDPLRRIHWRTSARRGELIVREFEPPGVQNVGIFCDPQPASLEVADQIARLAASEAWDCVRAGGRVTLWAPGCAPSRPAEERNMLALLEWLARYPDPSPAAAGDAPRVTEAIAVMGMPNAELMGAIDAVRAHGGPVRAWVVGDARPSLDIAVEHAGLAWPL